MYAIVSFGFLMAVISLVMVAKPDAWVKYALEFTRMPYMHPIEIAIRLGFGLMSLIYAEQTRFPLICKTSATLYWRSAVP